MVTVSALSLFTAFEMEVGNSEQPVKSNDSINSNATNFMPFER